MSLSIMKLICRINKQAIKMMTPIIRSDMQLFPGLNSGKKVVKKPAAGGGKNRSQSMNVIYDKRMKNNA